MLSHETHQWIVDTIEHATWLDSQRQKMYKEFIHYTYLFEREKADLEKKARECGLDIPSIELPTIMDSIAKHEKFNNENVVSLVAFA